MVSTLSNFGAALAKMRGARSAASAVSIIMNIEWKKILMPTDFSEGSKDALPYAVGAAREMGAELSVVHVVHPPPAAELLAFGVVLDEKLLMQEARKQLRKFREREIPSEIAGSAVVMKGTPWEEITRLAAERKFDLIVTATHGRGGLKHLWYGSTAERVVRHAPCPVLSVRQRPICVFLPGENPIRARRILAPTDFSELSITALQQAVALAKRFEARIDLIHVNEPTPYTDADYAYLAMVESALCESVNGELARLHAAVPGLKERIGEFVVRVGNPAFEVVQASLVLNSDLIVVATHGRVGLERLSLGSVAERVLRHASCPVLVLRNDLRTNLEKGNTNL